MSFCSESPAHAELKKNKKFPGYCLDTVDRRNSRTYILTGLRRKKLVFRKDEALWVTEYISRRKSGSCREKDLKHSFQGTLEPPMKTEQCMHGVTLQTPRRKTRKCVFKLTRGEKASEVWPARENIHYWKTETFSDSRRVNHGHKSKTVSVKVMTKSWWNLKTKLKELQGI